MTKSPSEITHLSNSSISKYLRCPRSWAAHYLDGKQGRIGSALIKGSAVDRVSDLNWQQKRRSGVDLPVDEAKEIAEDAWRDKIDEAGGRAEVDFGNEGFTGSLESALRLTTVHMRDHAPLFTPVATQKMVSRKLKSGRAFIGYIDAIDEDGTVIDVKASGRKMPQKDADMDLQATAYAFGLRRPIDFVFARVIDSGRAPAHSELVRTTRSEAGVAWYDELANSVDNAIDAGIFPASPGWHCGFCAVSATCIAAVLK